MEVVNGKNYFTKEKFGGIVLLELRKAFPRFSKIELEGVLDFQQHPDKVFRRSNILNSTMMGIYIIEYNNNEYEARIQNIFKKVPDEELTDKFTWADDAALMKMDFKSLEPKDLNIKNPLMIFKCRVKRSDDKVLIPKKPGYAILFDDYKTLNEVISDIKRVIDNDSGFEGTPTSPNVPIIPDMQIA